MRIIKGTIGFLFLMLLYVLMFSTTVRASKGNITPNWISTNRTAVEMTINSDIAYCEVVIMGKSNVTKIEGVLKLVYVNVDGTIENVASWNVSGKKSVNNSYYANAQKTGIYQLSFSGTTYMTDGTVEAITASRTGRK